MERTERGLRHRGTRAETSDSGAAASRWPG